MAVFTASALSSARKSHSSPLPCAPPPTHDDVIAPSFLCFEANRREFIRYPETYGVYREGKPSTIATASSPPAAISAAPTSSS